MGAGRYAGLPATLCYAGLPAWPRGRQCTNIETGTVAGDRPEKLKKTMFLIIGAGIVKNFVTLALRPDIGVAGYPSLTRRVSTGLPFGIAVIVLAGALGVAGAARAENECGPPEAGTPVVCSPSNYDAATDGNIVYHPSAADGDDFTIRLTDDLSVRYDRDDPLDDQLTCPLCGDPLYSAVWIETDADHVGNVSLFSSADVTSNARGISVGHHGRSGAMRTEISGGSFSIESDWIRAFAIHSYRGAEFDTNDEFSGDHDLIVRDVNVDLNGGWAGILGSQGVEGDLNVSVQDSDITVDARWATGIFGSHGSTGDVDVDVQYVNIDVSGASAIDGILGYHLGRGNTNIAVRDSSIYVEAEDWSSGGISFAYALGKGGDLSFDVRDVDIDISSIHGIYRMDGNEEGGRYFDGIWAGYWGEEGDIYVDVQRADIVTKGADSGGMSFIHDRIGDIDIAARNVDIKVEGNRSVGIGGGQRHEGTGDITIDVRDSTIAATGESVAGIRAFNFTGEGRIDIRVDGGTIAAEGEGSSGILVGLTGRLFESRTEPIQAPALRDVTVDASDNTRRTAVAQNVVVDGRVRGGTGVGAGVRLYGGGRVEIGSRGSVGADSGVAVRAEAEGAALHVGVELDGRRPSDAIAGEIRNDDGRTTVAVNGVVLHDGMTGATGELAPNGARDVSLAASETVAGRAFMPTDFVTGPYAPRAAVYEAMPGFMLRLDNRGTAGKRLRSPGSPAWVRISGGQGSFGPGRASVGAAYDFGRFQAEAGVEFALSREGNATGWVSLRDVRGSADVSAQTGGGKIEAAGVGASLGASWENAAGYYASGRLSVTRYETDLRADGRGLLKEGADARVRTLGVEAGRRFSLADGLSLMPQAWLTSSDVSMNGFRDAVRSRVSLRETVRSIVGLGVVTEIAYLWDGGKQKLDLRSRLGVERVLGDAETVMDVSGERLGSEAGRTRAVMGLGAAYRWNGWSWGGEVSASGFGADESDYTVGLRLRTQF